MIPVNPASSRSKLKENVLASRLETVVIWVAANRPKVLMALGFGLASVLLASVFVLRARSERELAWTRLSQAQFLIGQKKYSDAKQILTDLQSKVSGTLALHVDYELGETALYQKDYDAALRSFEAILSKAPKSALAPLALSNIVYLNEEKGDLPAARLNCQNFLDAHQDHFLAPRMQLALGRICALLGDKEGARKSLGQLIDLYPTSEWAKRARSLLDRLPAA